MSNPMYPLEMHRNAVEYITYYQATPYAGALWIVQCPDCGYVDPAGDGFDNLPEAYHCALDIQMFHYCPTPREVI